MNGESCASSVKTFKTKSVGKGHHPSIYLERFSEIIVPWLWLFQAVLLEQDFAFSPTVDYAIVLSEEWMKNPRFLRGAKGSSI